MGDKLVTEIMSTVLLGLSVMEFLQLSLETS